MIHSKYCNPSLLPLAALAAVMLWAPTLRADIIDNGPVTTDTATNQDWADIDLAWGVSFSSVLTRTGPGGDLAAEGWRLATQAEVTTFWANAGVTNAGVFSAPQYAPINSLLNKIKGSKTFQVDPAQPTTWYAGSRLQGLTSDGFPGYSWAPAMNIDHVGLKAYANTGHYQPQSVPNPDWGYWLTRTHVRPLTLTALMTKGEAVPGVAGKTFSGFGVPAINSAGDLAVLGKWSSGSGILVNGIVVLKVGDTTPAGLVKLLKDPVIDENGDIAAIGTLTGGSVTSTTDSVVFSSAPSGTVAIVAQEGTGVPEVPGAVWKSFTSVAVPGGGRGVLISGALVQGVGGITSANDIGLWYTNAAGVLKLALREGTTQIGGKTVKSFSVLKSVSGAAGQTRAFNAAGEIVAQVSFTDGSVSVVKIDLP